MNLPYIYIYIYLCIFGVDLTKCSSFFFFVDICAKHFSFCPFALDNLSDWCSKCKLVVRRY